MTLSELIHRFERFEASNNARLSRMESRQAEIEKTIAAMPSIITEWEDPELANVQWGVLPEVPEVPAGAVAAPDPRLAEAGWRVLAPVAVAETASAADWDAHRLALGLPEGSRDLEADKTVLLEAGVDELSGVSWTKGCYMGQELTARTKYRGLIKRRLVPVEVQGALPAPGTPVRRGEAEVGTLRSGLGGRALATLRLEALEGALNCGDAVLVAQLPGWMKIESK